MVLCRFENRNNSGWNKDIFSFSLEDNRMKKKEKSEKTAKKCLKWKKTVDFL